jgi:protease YdgD
MEPVPYSSSAARPERWIWAPVLACLVLCWPLICCCCLALGVAGWIAGPPKGNAVPETQNLPPVVTVPALPAGLDPAAKPLYGPVRLQRGFSPDPYTVDVAAKGEVDSSQLEQDCGFTTSSPTFKFTLSGGASETFLRLFFTANDGQETSLLVHTPDDEWLCETGSPYGRGADPVVDLQMAPSGEYAVWVGAQQSGAQVKGTLSLTGSMDVTP